MKKRILFAVLAMVLVLCGCSMKKAYKKAERPNVYIAEDGTTDNPAKEPEILEIEPAGLYLCMYVTPTLNSEDRYAKWSKMLLCCNCWHTYTKITDGEYLFRFDITDVFGEHYYSKLYLVEIEGEDIDRKSVV